MQTALFGLAGIGLAAGIGWLSWVRVAAPRGTRRTASRVEAELHALGLDGQRTGRAQPRT